MLISVREKPDDVAATSADVTDVTDAAEVAGVPEPGGELIVGKMMFLLCG